MQTRTHNPFTTIHTEGALLPTDLLQRVLVVDPELDGLSAADYHLPAGEKLNEAINRSWNRLQGSWAAFHREMEKLPPGDFGTGMTRDRWLLPLFQELGYGRLQTAKAIELDGKSYPISHRWSETPIHLVGCGIKLDQRTAGAAGALRSSPHSLLQELLNRSPELLWGLVSNGLRLRVLRDNASLTRQAFLEFDLESMFEGEIYSDFAVLWLVCHQSRVESREQRVENCWLEAWSKAAQEQGLRALESLRQGVEGAIAALGSGFLRAPANQTLRLDLRSGALGTQQYYRQLLRLVYRLIFLFVAEDRDLLFDPHSSPEARGRYLQHYSLARMRHMAERSRGGRHPDLYTALRLVTDILGGRKDSVSGKTGLGLPVLGGFLFSRLALPDLESAELENESLLSAIRHLTFMDQGRTRRVVDYKNLGARELGSVYESLLELHPLVNTDAATFELTAVSGSERKTTGSFFTPEELISLLLDSALNPVIAQALAGAGSSIEKQIAALLNLKICDPACGSGHFLLAAARKLARLLAQLRTGEGEPAPEAMRAALREVISNCIYGVDINPMSVELCKVSLWMEALEPGKPLSFLDAHIQCGDSLVGVSPNLDISEIPDEAFNPAFGDDKATAAALKKRNKRERGGSHADKAGQLGFRFEVTHMTNMDDLARWLAERAEQVDAMPEDDSTQVQAKAKAFDDYHATSEYLKNRFELDLWTAAFFWNIPKADGETMLAPTQQELIQLRNGGELDTRLVELVKELAGRLNFFHWELAFPKVFSGENPGFDCVLGNPPWERLSVDDKEFFAKESIPEMDEANTAERKKIIEKIKVENPNLYSNYETHLHLQDSVNKFITNSERFLLSAKGRLNTYLLFLEHCWKLIKNDGYMGLIIQGGLATDEPCSTMFRKIVEDKALIKLFDFENKLGIFPAIHRQYNFDLVVMCSGNYSKKMDFAFYLQSLEDLADPTRHIALTQDQFSTINPNTLTSPVMRSNYEAEILVKIHERTPVLVNESLDQSRADFLIMFISETGSGSYKKEDSLLKDGFVKSDNKFAKNGVDYVPLYEAKLIHQYDFAYATYRTDNQIDEFDEEEKSKTTNYIARTKNWVPVQLVNEALERKNWKHDWLLGYRDVTNPMNERTAIASVFPRVGAAQPLNIILPKMLNDTVLILSATNSLVCDFVARRKIIGRHLNITTFRQLPIPTLADISKFHPHGEDAYTWLLRRVLELTYTSEALNSFAKDFGYTGTVFRFDENKRRTLRAEIDGFMAHLYGVSKVEFSYILDTFMVLKQRDETGYNKYKTKEDCLIAFDQILT